MRPSEEIGLQNSHVRQHYIPKFILKNFCYDRSKEKVYFFGVGEEGDSSEFVSNVFMEKHLYAQAEDHAGIEDSLAKFEADIAPVFKKLVNDAEIGLTVEEDARLRIFLSLLAFRASATRDQFDGMSPLSRAMYGGSPDGADMKEIWLNNVRALSKCRNINEVLADPEISGMLKIFISEEFTEFYMCLLERRGDTDFHISDCYPVVMDGEGERNGQKFSHLPIYYFYPISDSRVIVLVTKYIKDVPRSVARLDHGKILRGPKGSSDRTLLFFRPAKIYSEDVEWIDEMIVKNARMGVVVKDLDRCCDSLPYGGK